MPLEISLQDQMYYIISDEIYWILLTINNNELGYFD